MPASSYIHRRAARCDTSDKKAGAGAGSDIGHYVVRAAENDTGCLIVSAAEPKGSPGILSLVAACRRKGGGKKTKSGPHLETLGADRMLRCTFVKSSVVHAAVLNESL